ncbi:MAG: anaerobic ribonucleoside-triphosphate reductase activating protein [Lachnospiraceae bacterium]|nr:anaerobic ribonucleoside-triphosphate reductase activating protein [Lachnospiraceae bacterium]
MRYHNITKDDMLNGDGLRVVLWLSGCSHHCKNCQNPITWDPMGGVPFDEAAKQALFEQLDKDYISGITFSGGDPLFVDNREELLELVKELRRKYPKKNIWLYTGYRYEEIRNEEVLKYLDVVVDGRYIEAERDTALPWKGSANQRVIDIPKTRQLGQIVLYA